MGDALRRRSERIREIPSRAPAYQPVRRSYNPGVDLQWCILRVVDETSQEIWAQLLQYAGSTPVEDSTEVVGDFVRVYPPPGVQYTCFTPFVRPLLDAITRLPIMHNPTVDASGTENQAERAAFDAAVAAELLRSNVYPFLMMPYQSVQMVFQPIWCDPNVSFYDERQQMNEGSSA